ncbi:hypothetical protein C2845_PM01G44340 [Panicum miliaceum]|uniref:Cystathionine gamma-synthase 1, chloroplastic-like n=1 Tax=Panicum miliaceum TaxID=4540 RepID=A0A3L6TT68_PANMI|nr:hypothetical protein C2845_PM01G44340 [Panicum miliaceum]
MALRVEAQNSTALRMARFLECHPKVEWVHYPGLNSSRWYQVAHVQMAGYGGVVTFEMKSDLHGTMSLGGCESLSVEEKSKKWIKDNLVRFSIGIEKFKDLRDDILQALEKI